MKFLAIRTLAYSISILELAACKASALLYVSESKGYCFLLIAITLNSNF